MSQTDGGGDSKAPAKKRQKLTEAEKEEKRKEKEAKEKEREAKEKERAEKVCLPIVQYCRLLVFIIFIESILMDIYVIESRKRRKEKD